MITIIFGAPGAGKSSLNTYFLKTTYETQGRAMLAYTRRRIEALNGEREHKLTVPDKPPIFSDFKVRFKIGYEKWFEPYFINGFYLGLPNERLPIQYIPPGSKIFLSEVQRYYYSRNSQTMPDWVSRGYEMHRHYGTDFFMDVQRVMLVDKNIRELCKHFIEVQGMSTAEDKYGQTVRTEFHCREFENNVAVEEYLSTGSKKTYTSTKYTYNGDIFRCFDSFNYFNEFVPKGDCDFTLLPFADMNEEKEKGGENARYYDFNEPAGYRGKEAKKK